MKKIKESKIPKTLDECYETLDNLKGKMDFGSWKQTFNGWTSDTWIKMVEQDSLSMVHHSIGQWIRNEWGLWGNLNPNTDISNWFEDRGVKHADDKSSIILTSYHRHKNGKDIKLEEQMEFYIEYWLSDKEKLSRRRSKKLKNIDEKKR